MEEISEMPSEHDLSFIIREACLDIPGDAFFRGRGRIPFRVWDNFELTIAVAEYIEEIHRKKYKYDITITI